MTYTHKGTVFKISEIIFNMRIFAIKVIRTALIFSDFSNFYKKLAKLAVWRDFSVQAPQNTPKINVPS